MGLMLGTIGSVCAIAWLVIVVSALLAILKSDGNARFLEPLMLIDHHALGGWHRATPRAVRTPAQSRSPKPAIGP